MKKQNMKKLIAAALVLGSICGINHETYAAVQNRQQKNATTPSIPKLNPALREGWTVGGNAKKRWVYKDGVLQKNTIVTFWGVTRKCDKDGFIVGEIVSDSADVDQYMGKCSEDYKNHDKRWKKVDGNWHFCRIDDCDNKTYSEDRIIKNKWVEINTYWYHFNEQGNMDKNTTIADACGDKCVLNSDGVIINNKKPVEKIDYSSSEDYKDFNPPVFTNKDGKTYCTDKNEKIKTGWVDLEDKSYFCDKNGVVLKNTSIIYEGKRYTFDKNGVSNV